MQPCLDLRILFFFHQALNECPSAFNMFSLVDQQFEEVDGGALTMALEYLCTTP